MQGVCCPLLHVIKKKIFPKQMLEENNTLYFLQKFIGFILFKHLLKKDFFFLLHAAMDNKLLAWQQAMERKTGGESTMGVNFIGTPLKRRCGEMVKEDAEKSILESVPLDIYIRMLYSVDHDDLKQLFHVSRTIRDATITARKSHFAYSTPSKVLVFRNSLDWEEPSSFGELQTPNVPMQLRRGRSRLKGKPSFAAALFLDEECVGTLVSTKSLSE